MAGDGRSPKRAMFQQPFGAWPQRLIALATAAYAGVLVFATHYPKPEELVGGRLPSDKLLHFVAYGLLGLLAALMLRARGRLAGQTAPLLAAGLAAWAVIDEATQPLFGRAADPLDWVYDVIGIALGIAIVVALNAMITSSRARPGRPG